MYKKIVGVMTIAILLAVMVNTAPLFAIAKLGQSGFTFLELPATARQAALGEAYIALSNSDAAAVFTNPAAIGQLSGISASVTYGDWVMDTNHKSGALAVSLDNYGTLALSVIHADMGDFKGTVTGGAQGYTDTGNFTMGAYAVGISYAYQMTDRFAFGGTVRYVKESVNDYKNASGEASSVFAENFLGELGTLYNTGFGSLRIATVVQNFGFNSEFLGDAFQPPIVYRMGVAYDFFDRPGTPVKLTTILEAIHPTDQDEKIHIGGELWFQNMIALRGGYKFDYEDESWTVGGGFQFEVSTGQFLGIDISYVTHQRFGEFTRFSVSGGF